MGRASILIVDDEASILASLEGILEDEDYDVHQAESGEQALRVMREVPVDLVLLDIWMPGMDGLETLQHIKNDHPDVQVVMMSGHGTIETAVRATKLGAYDFIEKPLSLDKVALIVSHALEQKRLEEENRNLRQRLQWQYEIVGESPAIRHLMEQIRAAGPTNGRVMICGESGTGKELVARAIHAHSLRRDKPFVEVNCAAIPQDLIESEIFGHERGAFTGALATKRGKFELADGGTLFLDEIGDMSLETQAKVLRVLQEQRFERVGGTRTIRVDVRVIAASNKNLEEEIRAGRFRSDLYYRLNVIPLWVPPLREREGDIPLLVHHFLREFSREYGKKPKSITPEAMRHLCAYPWPGNVRELKNIIERLVIMIPGPTITEADIPPALRQAPSPLPSLPPSGDHDMPLREARAAFEKAYIERKLRENAWNVSRTAEKLRIERSNLHRKIKALGIRLEGSQRP